VADRPQSPTDSGRCHPGPTPDTRFKRRVGRRPISDRVAALLMNSARVAPRSRAPTGFGRDAEARSVFAYAHPADMHAGPVQAQPASTVPQPGVGTTLELVTAGGCEPLRTGAATHDRRARLRRVCLGPTLQGGAPPHGVPLRSRGAGARYHPPIFLPSRPQGHPSSAQALPVDNALAEPMVTVLSPFASQDRQHLARGGLGPVSLGNDS